MIAFFLAVYSVNWFVANMNNFNFALKIYWIGYYKQSQLYTLYEQGTVTEQRKIVGSMFPKKLTFDGCQYRTTRVNEVLRLMLLFDKTLQGKKMGQIRCFLTCPKM